MEHGQRLSGLCPASFESKKALVNLSCYIYEDAVMPGQSSSLVASWLHRNATGCSNTRRCRQVEVNDLAPSRRHSCIYGFWNMEVLATVMELRLFCQSVLLHLRRCRPVGAAAIFMSYGTWSVMHLISTAMISPSSKVVTEVCLSDSSICFREVPQLRRSPASYIYCNCVPRYRYVSIPGSLSWHRQAQGCLRDGSLWEC